MVLNNQLKDSSFNNNINTKLTNMLNMNSNGNCNVKQQQSINNKLNSIINTNNNSSTSCANQSNVNNGLSSNTNNNLSSNNIVNGNSSSASTSTTFNHVGNLVNGVSSPSTATTGTKVLSSDDKKINLNALKNQDPFATNILDTALRVAVYKFLSKKNEWKKMDVEGSLFLFERMVEPLHSFAVMNTLALNLFLQPITSDLEFQDRNPFLLYKSNNDIFGIWFIDKEDCERIKNLIINLTSSAKERRERKLQQKSTNPSSLSDQVDLINNLMTPVSLEKKSLSNSLNKILLSSSTNNVNNSINENSDNLKNEKNNVDILDMLAKAQQQFNNQTTNLTNVKNSLNILEPTSHSTPGGANTFVDSNNEPKTIISQWPLNDLILNSNQYIKPEPIRAATTSNTNDNINDSSLISDNSLSADKINPILKLLMSSNSIANMASNSNTGVNNEPVQAAAANDQLSLDLKRKLNILGSSNNNNILSSPITVTGSMSNSSMILTPSNSSVIMSSTTNQNNQTSATLESVINILKKPITVKDFEENLLNNPSSSQQSTPSTTSSHPKTTLSNMFYLPNENISLSSSNDLLYNKLISMSNSAQKAATAAVTGSSTSNDNIKNNSAKTNSSNNVKDQKLSIGSLTTTSISSVTCSSNNSTTSSSSTSSDSSSSDSESEPQSPNTLPLLLTPAAFESSASSTTSSSFNPTHTVTATNVTTNHFFNNLITNTSQHDSSVNTTTNSNIASKLSTTTASTTTTNNNNNTNSSSSIDLNEHANNFANSFENILISNINEKNNGSPNDNGNIQQMSLLNKNQLQQVLVHLLNTDEQFLTSLHQAYVKSTCQNQNKLNKSANNNNNSVNINDKYNNKSINNNNNTNSNKQFQNANKTPSQNQIRHNNNNNNNNNNSNSKQNINNNNHPISYAKIIKK